MSLQVEALFSSGDDMQDYSNLTITEILKILDSFRNHKLLFDFTVDERFSIIVWDILNNNLSYNTIQLAKDIMDDWPQLAPDLARSVAEWNLDFSPDETLFALIDELVDPAMVSS